jgi:glycosyltransferase involved in cell wall biosynthesis
VVRDGIDGFVVPTRDDHAIVDALLRLRANEQLYGDMSQAAVKRAADFSPASHFASLTASAK